MVHERSSVYIPAKATHHQRCREKTHATFATIFAASNLAASIAAMPVRHFSIIRCRQMIQIRRSSLHFSRKAQIGNHKLEVFSSSALKPLTRCHSALYQRGMEGWRWTPARLDNESSPRPPAQLSIRSLINTACPSSTHYFVWSALEAYYTHMLLVCFRCGHLAVDNTTSHVALSELGRLAAEHSLVKDCFCIHKHADAAESSSEIRDFASVCTS